MAYTFVYETQDFIWSLVPYWIFFRCVYWLSYFSGTFVNGYDEMKPGDKSLWGSAFCSTFLSIYLPYKVWSISITNGGKILFFDYPVDTFKDDEIVEMSRLMLGYFFADLIPCLQHRTGWGKDWWVFAVHHISAIWYFWSCIMYEGGHCTLLSVSIVELSNFFNNNRMYMSKAQVGGGKSFAEAHPTINIMNALGFTISFLFLRIFGFTFTGYHALVAGHAVTASYPVPFVLAIHSCFVIGITLQIYWFDKIVRGLYKIMTKKRIGKE